MRGRVRLPLAGALLTVFALASPGSAGEGRRFTLSTKSPEAKTMLRELQLRIESFQFGPPSVELARKMVAADPNFALGQYYLSVVVPPTEGQPILDKAVELAKTASDGERRFIEALAPTRNLQTATGPRLMEAITKVEALSKDYPEERLAYVILGQLYQGTGQADKAVAAFQRCEPLPPPPPPVRGLLAHP